MAGTYPSLQLAVNLSVARNPQLALTLEQPNRLEYLSILQKIVTKDYPTFPATLLPRAVPPLPGIIPVPPIPFVQVDAYPVGIGRGRIRVVLMVYGITRPVIMSGGSRGVQPAAHQPSGCPLGIAVCDDFYDSSEPPDDYIVYATTTSDDDDDDDDDEVNEVNDDYDDDNNDNDEDDDSIIMM